MTDSDDAWLAFRTPSQGILSRRELPGARLALTLELLPGGPDSRDAALIREVLMRMVDDVV